MSSKVIDYQCFYKAIGKHVDVLQLLDFEFAIAYQFLNIMMLNNDMLGTSLALNISSWDNASFFIFM